MSDSQTTHIQGWIDRLKAGDESARSELLKCASARLTRLARRMLTGYPRVRQWEQTDDVLNNAIWRLYRALESVTPLSVRDFLNLAAVQIRRELTDLARYYSNRQAVLHPEQHLGVGGSSGSSAPAYDPPDDSTRDPRRLDTWTDLHEQVGRLPETEREVFDLLWYQGLSRSEAAAVLGISKKTLQRRWLEARISLQRAMRA
jgi:RNA polymerase sigma-70 factor (ECF subfamily)